VLSGTNAPHERYYIFDNVQQGDVSNDGTSDVDYVTSIARHRAPPAGAGFFQNGASSGTSFRSAVGSAWRAAIISETMDASAAQFVQTIPCAIPYKTANFSIEGLRRYRGGNRGFWPDMTALSRSITIFDTGP
jgi:hypothetical protein